MLVREALVSQSVVWCSMKCPPMIWFHKVPARVRIKDRKDQKPSLPDSDFWLAMRSTRSEALWGYGYEQSKTNEPSNLFHFAWAMRSGKSDYNVTQLQSLYKTNTCHLEELWMSGLLWAQSLSCYVNSCESYKTNMSKTSHKIHICI